VGHLQVVESIGLLFDYLTPWAVQALDNVESPMPSMCLIVVVVVAAVDKLTVAEIPMGLNITWATVSYA
jgi:hypothetical protein